MGDATADAAPAAETTHRKLIGVAVEKLRECGKIVTTCTIQSTLREHLGVNMSLREIIEARRP